MDFIKVLIPSVQILTNPKISQLAITALMIGGRVEGSVNGNTVYTNIKNDNFTYNILTYEVMSDIVSLGGNIFNYHSFVKINVNDDVPNYIRDYTNVIDGNSITLSWSEWIHPNHTVFNIDGDTYISSHAHYAGYKLSEKYLKGLNGIELTQLRSDGYTVLNEEEFMLLLNVTNE